MKTKKTKLLNEINLKKTNKEEIRQALLIFQDSMESKCLKAGNDFPKMFFTLEDEYCDKPSFRRCEENFHNVWFGFAAGHLVESKNGDFYETTVRELTERLWKVIERDY